MSEMHLRQSTFAYHTCGPFTKKKKNKKIKNIGDLRYFYRNELDKAFFQHDQLIEIFKDLPRIATSDKVLCDKAFNIVKNPKYE